MSDLQIGLSGILTAQRAMLIASHNISNANTKGYTRQSAVLSARNPMITTAGTMGQGVELVKIIRHKDDYLNSRLRDLSSSIGSASVKSQYLKELETVFNETSESSLNNALSSFFQRHQRPITKPGKHEYTFYFSGKSQHIDGYLPKNR